MKMKKFAITIYVLSICLSYNAQDLDKLWDLANIEHAKLNYQLADSFYSEAIKIDFQTQGKNFGLYFNRGLCRYELNQFDLAIIDFDNCLKIYPYYAPAYREKAKCYYVKNDYKTSRLFIDKCYSITNKDLDNLILGIMTCIADTNIVLGKEYVKKAKSVNKDDRVYGLYSILLSLNGEHAKALTELQTGQEKFSNSEHIYEGFVVYYYNTNDVDLMSKYVNLLESSFPYVINDIAFRKKVQELFVEQP
jgi:tetratricopeptide (TPR) repeat protein